MELKRLSAEEVQQSTVRKLGLDPTALDMTSTESLSNALRRAAGMMCPCSPMTLVRAVLHPLEGILNDLDLCKNSVEATLEALVAYGDLLEHRDIAAEGEQQSSLLLYAAPPSFVSRQSGTALLMGITPDQLSPLPDDLQSRIEYINHVRRLPGNLNDDLRLALIQLGLCELSPEAWLREPAPETPEQHVTRLDRLLESSLASGEISGLRIIDPKRSSIYYPDRWIEPRSQTGRFVGRRPQAYGAALWCYVELDDGNPQRFLDLPLPKSKDRGCDEAWRLQMAIDAACGQPQCFRLRKGPPRSRVLEILSPTPMWTRRRWDAIGEPVPSVHCLFAYRLLETELTEELQFLRQRLWLKEIGTEANR